MPGKYSHQTVGIRNGLFVASLHERRYRRKRAFVPTPPFRNVESDTRILDQLKRSLHHSSWRMFADLAQFHDNRKGEIEIVSRSDRQIIEVLVTSMIDESARDDP